MNVPSGKQFFAGWMRIMLASSLASVSVIALYLLTLLRLPPDQLREFLFVVLPGVALLMFGASAWTSARMFGPLQRALDRYRDGSLDALEAREGFRYAANIPVLQFLAGLGWWLVAGVLVAGAMKFRFESFTWFSFTIMLVAAVTGALVSMIVNFHLLKRNLDPIRGAFGARLLDAAERGRLVHPIPLGHKLLVSVVGIAVMTMGFAVMMAEVLSRQNVESLANRVNEQLLTRGAEALASGRGLAPGKDLESSVLGARLVLLDADASRVVSGPKDLLLGDELSAIRALGERGDSARFDTPNVFAWRTLGSGILVAVADPAALAASAGQTWAKLGIFAALALMLAVGLARLASDDAARMTRALIQKLERVAGGDLTPGDVVESEDELGELARGFERMTSALRVTVGGVVEAAHGVEQTASDIAAVGDDLGDVTADQVQAIERVSASMGSIRTEVSGIADSAHALSMSVEESSSSVLELGVTSEQFSQNASALSGRVSEVSGSIEQMMRSGKQALGSIEELAGASAETSTSIEQMATSMRDVDANAAETARLSSHMVDIADSGRSQVEQTIRGMQDIQLATDTAREVIRGLGQRAGEIGSILNVIDDVADETNLLALNAAIIAAQAGEHGRAFSVVADEIKDLADKVLASTKEIGGLIRAVQEEVGNAVGAIETGARSVESGVELSAEAGVALEKITTAARESGDRIAEIVSAVQEQSKAAAHVVTLMESVKDGAESIRGASSEQIHGNEVVLRSASAMSEVAEQVRAASGEQAGGSLRMRDAIENVRSVVEQIHHSLQGQSNACQQIADQLDRIHGRTRSNEESAQRMREAMRGLLQQAEGLREGVRHFRV